MECLGSCAMAMTHALGPVSQESSSLREDLTVSCHGVLGAGLQGGAICSIKAALSAQSLVAALLQPQDSAVSSLAICDVPGWVLLALPGQAGGHCSAWSPSGRELIRSAALREGNLAGLRHQWKVGRATCVPSSGKRLQLGGTS